MAKHVDKVENKMAELSFHTFEEIVFQMRTIEIKELFRNWILCQGPSILYSSYILQIDKWVDQNQTDEWEVAGLKLKWEMDKSLD